VITQFAFQFSFVQDVGLTTELATYAGYVVFPTDEGFLPAHYLMKEIFLVLLLALASVSRDWRKEFCRKEGRRYDPEGEFALLPFPGDPKEISQFFNVPNSFMTDLESPQPTHTVTENPVPVGGEAVQTVSDVEENPEDQNHPIEIQATQENVSDEGEKQPSFESRLKSARILALQGIVFFFNNFLTLFGYELALVMHLIAGLVRLNVVGLIYVLILAIWIHLPKKSAARCVPNLLCFLLFYYYYY
jgi:hypothetical protein